MRLPCILASFPKMLILRAVSNKHCKGLCGPGAPSKADSQLVAGPSDHNSLMLCYGDIGNIREKKPGAGQVLMHAVTLQYWLALGYFFDQVWEWRPTRAGNIKRKQ